jgi:hypothetical protein
LSFCFFPPVYFYLFLFHPKGRREEVVGVGRAKERRKERRREGERKKKVGGGEREKRTTAIGRGRHGATNLRWYNIKALATATRCRR